MNKITIPVSVARWYLNHLDVFATPSGEFSETHHEIIQTMLAVAMYGKDIQAVSPVKPANSWIPVLVGDVSFKIYVNKKGIAQA